MIQKENMWQNSIYIPWVGQVTQLVRQLAENTEEARSEKRERDRNKKALRRKE